MKKLTDDEMDLVEQVCQEGGCYNFARNGFVYCNGCMHGQDWEVGAELRALKDRWVAQKRQPV